MRDLVLEKEQSFGEVDKIFKNKKLPTIYRLTSQVGDGRFYFTQDENGEITLYNSGTTLIDNYKDKRGEEALHKWKVDWINKGINPDEKTKERASYGTVLHILYASILNGVDIEVENVVEVIVGYSREVNMTKEYLRELALNNEMEFKKDLLSFYSWLKQYNVKPLAIEMMLKSDKYKVATAIDLICEIDVEIEGYFGEVYKSTSKKYGYKKGDPKLSKSKKREIIICDFKSGKKGFYPKNALQLLLNKELVKENFPKVRIGGLYNFAPSAWKGKNPTFSFINQDHDSNLISSKLRQKLNRIKYNDFERGLIEFEEERLHKKVKVLKGKVSLKDNTDVSDMVQMVGLDELAKEHLNSLKNE